MYLWPFTNLIFTDDTASTDQHHAIYRRIQKKCGGGGVTPPHPPPIATPLRARFGLVRAYEDNYNITHFASLLCFSQRGCACSVHFQAVMAFSYR